MQRSSQNLVSSTTHTVQPKRLDSLIVQKCVILMKQKFSTDFQQKLISHEFSNALQHVHSKIAIVLKLKLDCILIRSQKKGSSRWISDDSNSVSIQLDYSHLKVALKYILTHIFAVFKRIGELDYRMLDEESQKIFVKLALTAGLKQLDEIIMDMYCGPDYLIENFTSLIKKIQLDEKIYSTWNGVMNETAKVFNALSQCNNLRRLRITFRSYPYLYAKSFLNEVQNGIKALKISQLQFIGRVPMTNSSDTWLFNALESNEYLSTLQISETPKFFCSPVLYPLLSRLHCVSVFLLQREITALSSNTKQRLLQILQSIKADGKLIIDIDVLNEAKDMLDMLAPLMSLSEYTRKLILLNMESIGFGINPIEKKKIILDILLKSDEYRDSVVDKRFEKKIVLHKQNARMKLIV